VNGFTIDETGTGRLMRHVRTPWRQWLPHGILLALLTVVLAGCGGAETYPQSTLGQC
jgi:hypothetical protein